MKKYLLFNLLIFFLNAQSGIEIANMVDSRKIPKDQTNITKIVLTNSKGKQRTNIVKSKSMDGNKKQIMWFMEPKDDKGVAFLKIENDGKDDEMRMWLPAFKKVRRISSKKRGDSFMGSDLSYEDLSTRKIADHDYSRLDDQTLNSKLCYVLEISPKKGANSSYSKHISWIEQSSLMILKEQSFDKRGQLKKKKEFFNKELNDYLVMERIFVEDVQKKHSTEVTFAEYKVDTGISIKLFQEKNLKRLPRN